jgi:hypothetical protein
MTFKPNRALSDAAVEWLQEVLRERLCPSLRLSRIDANTLSLGITDGAGSIVFDRPAPTFLTTGSEMPCTSWDPRALGWTSVLGSPIPAPGIADLPVPLIEEVGGGFSIHYDILGLVFWMLSRREEVGRIDLDQHARFPASASHAFRHGYLDRPVVDEWLDVLGQILVRLWPQLRLVRHSFDIKLSHDVDLPSRYAFRTLRGFVRAVGEDIIRRGRFMDALRAPWILLNSSRQLHPADPSNTFDWLMTVSERLSLKSAFYFICGRTNPAIDAGYEPEDGVIRALMREIHRRGHEIGLHPSYGTYLSPDRIAEEASRLRRVCSEEGIVQREWGGRMHYLRWSTPLTLYGWEQAGMTYDSTLGYADCAGFRCGTCHEYPAFDPVASRRLELRIRPLIAWEGAIMAKQYMGLGYGEAAYAALGRLKRACRAVRGSFSLLWHNSELSLLPYRELYESVLAH